MNLNAKGKKLFGTVNESTELREKYDSSLLKLFYIRGRTGRLYATDAMPKEFAKKKKKRHRLEAKSTQSLKWHSRENRGKNKDGGTTQRKIKKHDKQKLMQKNTARYWTCAELEPKCSINFFQYTEFVQSCFSQDRKIYKQQTTRVRISSSFLGHLQHSHSAWYHLVAATQHF